jgi:uncharacterized peroxidase-related enzyme
MALLFDRSGLTRAKRELITVVVSAANGREYCVIHHPAALQAHQKDEARAREAIHGYAAAALSPRERAMADYWGGAHPRSWLRTELHVEAMREIGLSDAEILNANMATVYFNFVNRSAEGLGVDFSPGEVAGCRY